MYKKAVLISSANVIIDRAPAGLAFLAGICEHNQLDYEIFDLNIFLKKTYGDLLWQKIEVSSAFMKFNYPDEQFKSMIHEAADQAASVVLKYNPDLIAITSLSHVQIAWTEKLLSAIRKRQTITTIGGGPGISFEQIIGKTAGRILADQGLLDYYVLGEGDYTFNDFLKGKIGEGVNSKEDSVETWVPQLDNLNDIILPTYKKINFSDYGVHVSGFKIRPTINITGSRGCVRRCTFCDIGHLWKKFRFRSADSIVAEILKSFYESGCTEYFFNDSLMNGSMKQFVEVMKQLIKHKQERPELESIRYSGQFIIRPQEQHPEYIFELMMQSGCNHIQVGLESGSEAVRTHMGKKFSNADVNYHLTMCDKYKIKNFINMIIAYPTETLEDFEETKNFYIENQKYLINEIIMGTNVSAPMGIYKNTPIHHMKNELGIEIHNTEYFNSSNWTVATNPTLTVKERYRRYVELATLTTQLRYPKATDELVFLEMNIEDIRQEIRHRNKTILLKEEK